MLHLNQQKHYPNFNNFLVAHILTSKYNQLFTGQSNLIVTLIRPIAYDIAGITVLPYSEIMFSSSPLSRYILN